MAIHYVKLVEASDPHDFQTQLQHVLYTLSDDITVPPESIEVSLALGPGPHFGALVRWVSVELEMLEAPATAPAAAAQTDESLGQP